MKRKLALILAVLMMASALAACGAQTSAVSPFRKLRDDALAQSIDGAARAFFEEEEPVGLSIGVLRDGKVQFFNYGVKSAGGAAVTENTQYEIASVSKTMAGIILGTLSADPGLKIETTNTVQQFMPYFQLPEYEGKPIQWWHLSAHVSGLPRLPDNFEDSSNPYADYTAEKLRYYLSEQAHLYNEPGTEYRYSNLGVGFLGYALSYAMRTPYEDILKSRLLWPLGMSRTAITLSEEEEENRAMPHTQLGTQISQWDFAALQACGGVKSTTYDLLLYLAANMGQIPVESEYLRQGMQEAQKVWFDDGQTAIGLGFIHGSAAGKKMLWHNGATGGYRSFIGFVPETGTGVAVLCNSAIDVDELAVEILSFMQS